MRSRCKGIQLRDNWGGEASVLNCCLVAPAPSGIDTVRSLKYVSLSHGSNGQIFSKHKRITEN